jgi:crossover junction endodeoxyribonuclease RuvC
MIILGIDPGFGRLGWGLVKNENGKQTAIEYGCIETDPNTPLEARISDIYSKITGITEKYKPDSFAIEDLFFGTNVTTALSVGQARGVIMLAAYKKNIPIKFYKPVEIKMAVTGYGASTKAQIQQMVKMILHLKDIPKPDDAADALAIALTHCFSHKMKGLT